MNKKQDKVAPANAKVIAWAVLTKGGAPQELMFTAPNWGRKDREEYWNEQFPDLAPHRCVTLVEGPEQPT